MKTQSSKMKAFYVIFGLLTILFTTGCKEKEDPIGNKFCTLYIEFIEEDGNPMITNEEEANDFPLLNTVAVEPNDSFFNFGVISKATKKENGRYYFEVTNHQTAKDEYKFIINSKFGLNAEYVFEVRLQDSTLKSIKINSEETPFDEVSFDGRKSYTVSLKKI